MERTQVQWQHGEYTIDTDRERLDFEVMIPWIQGAYWALGRPEEIVQRSWAGSGVVFGIYRGDAIVGWARVITDFAVTSYLADVFILPEHRGRGLGRWLMETILNHPEVRETRWLLHTRDAHGLYERFGFQRMSERIMERPRPE